eukprot:CCRYP_003284-RA/>CCRYP_003284-RA protein AED:0.47 eAED:0.62 QI:0/-1/0/1/-1/0/1/0/77
MTPSRNNDLAPWKCISSGIRTKSTVTIFKFAGTLAKKTWQITSLNTLMHDITYQSNRGTSIPRTSLNSCHRQQPLAL